jgi:hypothetical protein
MKVDDIFKEKDIVAQDRMLIKTTVWKVRGERINTEVKYLLANYPNMTKVKQCRQSKMCNKGREHWIWNNLSENWDRAGSLNSVVGKAM